MTGHPVKPIGPEAVRGESDWDDEDLLTVAEASQRLAREIDSSRRRIRRAETALSEEDAPTGSHASGLAAERKRLQELIRAAERICAAQAHAPR
jgi:hypothetical protein